VYSFYAGFIVIFVLAIWDAAVSYALDYRSNLMEVHSLFIELLHADR